MLRLKHRAHISIWLLLEHRLGNTAEAYQILSALIVQDSLIIPLVARAILHAMPKNANRTEQALALLQTSYKKNPSLDVLDAIVELDAQTPARQSSARDWYVKHLENEPSLIAAAQMDCR